MAFGEAFSAASTPREARQTLVDLLQYELLGPDEDDEVVEESPLSRYLIGMLAPFGTAVLPEEQEDGVGEDEGEDLVGAPELTPPLSQALSPSSIGLSCLLDGEVAQLEATVTWGDYERLPDEPEPDEEGDDEPPASHELGVEATKATENDGDAGKRRRRRRREKWRRLPGGPVSRTLELRPGEGLQQVRITDEDDLYIEHVTRRLGDENRLAVSVFFVNRRVRLGRGRPPANTWIFQPDLSIRTSEGYEFLPRELEPHVTKTDRDLQSSALLYRNRREFGVGHGCAVEWESSREASVQQLGTTLRPSYELPRVDPRPIPGATLDMAALGQELLPDQLEALLRPIPDAYSSWIEEKRTEANGLPDELRGTAEDHLRLCGEALDRIADAIELLKDNPKARSAFAFANRAMLLQRAHSDWGHERSSDPEDAPAVPTLAAAWYPFQLAFILLNLRAIAEPTHADRQIGDLLWFPTGGGKTEAYLGLAAFTMALRRLRSDPMFRVDAGVTVLMRYTLRLLTIQQFQRASTLICACEVLRQAEPERWGTRRFSIGLWLGRQATPNSHADSRQSLARLRVGEIQDDANPCQFESCPWCGEALSVDDYGDYGDVLRTRVHCPRVGCEFNASSNELGLPVVMVDEELYRECPSMVIATVDKFAQMPWNGEVQALFGRVSRECVRCGFLTPDSEHPRTHRASGGQVATREFVSDTERLAPPELIIQDELHLISGPLGTMVGLYETAVDALCARPLNGDVVRPKVIASTATIRRAFEQVHALFNRGLRVFPPLALEADDSFFAVESAISDNTPGRLYLGVMAPGKSMKTALVRVSSALLSAAAGVRERSPQLADSYLTLVAYFNSLRELGGAVRLMEDDIGARLRQLTARALPQRNRPTYEELTSRVRSDRIPFLLRRLQTPHHSPRAEDDPLPLDAILASNMISVGVDVTRLGLMTVLGQPKTTAEYIQATSRVGRQMTGPGLVVTIYNWVRPRDLSHFERFRNYHATLYRHVEAVTVTPYSARARDRGLAGAFVSLTRLREEPLNPEEAAGRYDPEDGSVDIVLRAFRSRADSVADSRVADEVEQALKAYRDRWGELARAPLRYGWRLPYDENQPPPTEVLLRAAEGGRHGLWRVPGSLREVEEQSRIYLRGLDATGP